MINVGLEILAADGRRRLRPGTRVGLLCNQASTDARFRPARDVVHGLIGNDLVALFGPQHGFSSDVQDNMVESPHGIDPRLGIPVWSLYSDCRKPSRRMLDGLDVLVVDLQDVGARVYTFVWTLRLLLEACGERGIDVLVLDRPNPLGGESEGNLLGPSWASFVGLEPVPMRHGLTVGELARWCVRARGVDCKLEVVAAAGLRRSHLWPDTGRPWVMPSPNMPTFDTALVYPGTVLLEGTNASEGRGTTRPFEIVGGPWCDGDALAERLAGFRLPGVVFRAVRFLPTFQKWVGTPCGGVQLHVVDPRAFRPYLTGLAVLCAFWSQCRALGFDWKQPPYEYETERLPIHLLLGDDALREGIESGADPRDLEGRWAAELAQWREETQPDLLYD